MGYYDETQVAIARSRAKAKKCLHEAGRWTSAGYANYNIIRHIHGKKGLLEVYVKCLKCGKSWPFKNATIYKMEE